MKRLLMIASVIAACVAPVQAHHSYSEFDMTKTLTLVCTVKEFQWMNEHTQLIVTATNEAGVSLEYRFEGAPPAVLIRSGWTQDTLLTGDHIRLDYHPRRDDAPGGSYVAITLPNGKRLGTSGSAFVPFTPVTTPPSNPLQ
jgi:hypothetical protein